VAGGRDPSEWLERAGLAISSETREIKGQTWLTTRASATSMVDYERDHQQGGSLGGTADDEYSPVSARQTPRHSRTNSRVVSRRGSVVRGSKIDLGSLMTPGVRTPGLFTGERQGTGFFDGELQIEPDFLEPEEGHEGHEEDDEEVSQLTRRLGLGLGPWVDRIIGNWLFNEEDDGEDDATSEKSQIAPGIVQGGELEKRLKAAKAELKKRKVRGESDRVIIAPVTPLRAVEDAFREGSEMDGGEDVTQDEDEQEVTLWQDAAWLLSVAAKVVL
jgi:Protein of unknown function (DUF3984)